MKHTNGAHKNWQMNHFNIMVLELLVFFNRNRDISRSKVVVRNRDIAEKFCDTWSSRGRSIGYANWILSLGLNLFHYVPNATGWVRGTATVKHNGSIDSGGQDRKPLYKEKEPKRPHD
jgi:hypothetical protein